MGSDRRWEDDTRGRGVADARAFVEGATELVGAMEASDWVAEEPDVHLLPWIEKACESAPFELASVDTADDGTFLVSLRWAGKRNGVGAIRSAVFAVVGSFAESATYVRQRRGNGTLSFEIVTGMVDGDAPFTPHGHTVRLTVSGT